MKLPLVLLSVLLASFSGNALAENNQPRQIKRAAVTSASATESSEVHALKEKSAAGDINAIRKLGKRYRDGDGVRKDLKESVKLFQIAAEQGDAYSQNEFGFALLNGAGVEANVNEAYGWFKLSAAQKNPDAIENLAYLYGMKKSGVRFPGAAIACYMAAVQLGSASAKEALAKIAAQQPTIVKAAYAQDYLDRTDPLTRCISNSNDALFR